MGVSGGDSEGKLPPPPPGPPPETAAKVLASSSAGPQSSPDREPPGKRRKPDKGMVKAPPQFPQMKRIGFGSRGPEVKLLCNHFKVSFQPLQPVIHYNVSIQSKFDGKPTMSVLNRKVMANLNATFGQEYLKGKRFAYDGEKSLFVVGPLEFKSHEFEVSLEDDPGRQRYRPNVGGPGGREFLVKIEYAAKVDMNSISAVLRGEHDEKAQDALRVLDIMLREHAAKRSYLLLRDSYFHHSLGNVGNLGEGVESWRGFHVSFRPTSGGLSLNFDLSTTVLIQPLEVLVFIQEHCKKAVKFFRPEDWTKCKRILKGLMVETYFKRKGKITGLSPQPCSSQMFVKKKRGPDGEVLDNEEVSVADYFAKERDMFIKHPELPAVDMGRPNKPVYIPLELCTILPGQRYKKSLSTAQRQAHLDQARQSPEDRQRIIKEALKINNYNEDEMIKEFNVHISATMTSVSGRVLEAPRLKFGNNVEDMPRNGRWNFGTKLMKQPAVINNWAVACFRGRFPLDAKKIAHEMKTVCSQKGMKFGDKYGVLEEDSRLAREKSPLQRVQLMIERLSEQVPTPDFVLAILPEKSPDLYVPFKKIIETKIGIVTQCIVPPKGQVNPKYLTSVSLKINLKWGGYNSVLCSEETGALPKVGKVPTIIFGLDVSHGSPGDANSPSIAAAVATVDWPRVSRYTTSIRAQKPKVEIIQGLHEEKGGMVKELLINFYKHENRCIKPQQILVYRDGVSESQFEQVLEKELLAFKHACHAIDENYQPRITFVVVQKRHHTRFFPASGRGNVAPGTIVDRSVCHPRDNDFYLISHAGIIGTSRPTHYHVLYDEIGFSADELQHVTHSLCYSYARCTSAVSVVAPAYYAHLAAQHCRAFVDTSDSGSESSARQEAHLESSLRSSPQLMKKVLMKMFYA